MSYTWEEVMLGIDIRDEARKEEKEEQDILDKQQAEANAAKGWSLGLSILGLALFGPAGYAAGKIAGRYGADWGWFEGITGGDYSDWEEDKVSAGKFYKDQSRKANEIFETAAKDQTSMQTLNTLTDLATMYVQAGGLQEGFGETGLKDFTTFGTGDDAWTVFGEGTWADKIPGARTLPGEQSIFGGGGTRIWQKGGLKQLQENLRKGDLKGAYTTDLGINTVSDLARLWTSSEEIEEEKSKDRTVSSVGRNV